MRKLLFAIAFYISIIPLIGVSAFAFGYFYSAGVEMYYFNNPVEDVETISDFDSESEDAKYLM